MKGGLTIVCIIAILFLGALAAIATAGEHMKGEPWDE